MSTEQHDSALIRAVQYLEESDEPLQANASAIINAANSGNFSVEDVLSVYADRRSDNGVIYPSTVSQLRELQKALDTETAHATRPLDEICEPNDLIRTEDDVIMHALEIYNADNIDIEKRQEAIKALVKDAHRTGIDLDPDKVIQSIREFQSAEEYMESDIDVSPSEVTLATGITIPDDIVAEEEYVYKIDVLDEENIASIEWYIGGNHVGSGETILHTFEYPGVYTISVEVESTSGETDYLSKEVTVEGVSEVDVTVSGDASIKTGEPATFDADVVSRNVVVESLTWEIDQTRAGDGKTLTHTFQDPGEHTVTATATTASGDSSVDSLQVKVEQSTSVETEIDVPTEVSIGERFTVDAFVETQNTYIQDVTCTIDGTEVDVTETPENTFTHVFEEAGEHEISLTAVNGNDDSSITTEYIHAYIEPEITIQNAPDEVVIGDSVEVTADTNVDSTINWGVSNASLQQVAGDTATVAFNSHISDTATISAEIENDRGDVDSHSVDIIVHEPSVEATISGPSKTRVKSSTEFSVEESQVENTTITAVEWTKDGTTIGSGPSITHEFTEAGEHTIQATIHTDHDVSDSDAIRVEVKPETDITAIAIVKDGETTHDTFTLDASKSVADNVSIKSYEWEINDSIQKTGKQVSFDPDEPGDYTVELTVTSTDGDIDTDTEEFTVKPYTDVTAVANGPESTIVGEEEQFSARDSSVENTTIERYQWYLNNKPAGQGKTFSQTFSTPGHYTVDLEVISATNDSDTDSISVTVDSQESSIEPTITVRGNTVSGEVEFDASNTRIEHGTISSYEWDINGTRVGTDKTITDTFNNTGEINVSLTVTADDGVTETVTDTVYILPDPDDPPETIAETDSKTDILDKIVSVYETELPEHARNWFVAQLIDSAEDADITITADEVVAYVDDTSDTVDSSTVHPDNVDEYLVEPVEDSDASSSEVWDTGGTSDSTTQEDEVISATSEDVESEWDMGGATSDDDTTDNIITSEDTTEPSTESDITKDEQEPDSEGIEVDTEQEEIDTLDEDLIDMDDLEGDERIPHLEDRVPPEQYDVGGSVFSMPNYAQDIVNFEYVYEKDDELLPDEINGAGIVVTQNDNYIGIARVEGRDWAIHTQQKQRDIVNSFQTDFLSALENHIQIVSLPTRFDIRDHVERIESVLEQNKDDEDELLMNIGRSLYPNWMEGFMDKNDMKERQFYIVVPLSAEKLYEFKGGGESISEQLSDAPVIGNVIDRFTEDKEADITKYQILRELNTRMDRMSGNLRRINVDMNRVDDRDEAMAVLFHYYNNMEPDMQVFPRGPFTSSRHDAEIGGVSIGDLLQGEPNETVNNDE